MEISISDELNSIINFSREEAMRTGSYGIGPDHFFLGIIRHRENTAVDALRGVVIDLEEMKQFIDSRIFTNAYGPLADAIFDSSVRAVVLTGETAELILKEIVSHPKYAEKMQEIMK